MTFAEMTFKMSRAVRGYDAAVVRDAIDTIGELHKTWAACLEDGFRLRWYIYPASTHLGMNNVSDCRSTAEYEIVYFAADSDCKFGDWAFIRIK